MAHFAYKLIPPRPSFFADQTEQEQAVMADHVGYWTGLLAAGTAVVFGPVLDPAGVWGLGVVEAEDEAALATIAANDPVVKAGVGTIETYPMPGAIVRPAPPG
ncbi:YciI family protein [Plantactinospora siamensis]|uniref:YciI family protein n=1 Tax=Plantactinospora siamensis TaxID=555372 RepID=A0ABV6P423_9ACTN